MTKFSLLIAAFIALSMGGCASRTSIRDSVTEPLPVDRWARPFAIDAEVYPFESNVYRWNGWALHYVDVPPAVGTAFQGTVLAIHGNATYSLIYRKIVAPLSAAGFRVILTDQFGFGFSDKPPRAEFDYLPSTHAAVHSDFIRALDLEELYLVLHDWGGPIGLAAGVENAERVAGIVLMNTWAWQLPAIASGETAFMHAVHDRGIHATREPDLYRSGMLIRRGGEGLARRNAEPESDEYFAIRDAMWAPYFVLEEPYPLLYDGVTDSFHISAMATVSEAAFLEELDSALDALRETPVFFAFGDDTAFGPYKVDLGFLGDERRLCVEGFRPADAEPTVRTDCLDPNGESYWYPLERFLGDWDERFVAGVWRDASVGHWVQDERPEVVVDAVMRVRAFGR